MRWNYGPMGIGWFDWVLLAVIILVFLGGMTFVVLTATRQTPSPRPHTPEEILAERFARGEIDEEEFHVRREALRKVN